MREDQIKVMIDQETLENKIAELGAIISRDYEGKEIVLICILKGGAMFMMQLAKSITVPVTMDFMVLSSYGNELISSGEVKIKKDLDDSIEGKHVLIVEDIVDTGRTLSFLSTYLVKKGAASVQICTMLDKPARRVVPVDVKYSGFEIADEFVLGYGLDYAQKYRNLPYIAYVEQEE
ncbi:MAG: hypoxanthine phosphoribosyltransferase [Firmicutes bacterium]|nr:hypoxanthine phosphoribosyltransferase [Bacillota bacterium]MBQ7058628.1 hypoxanthine phosphoribosyltransferase [Bacillota bacterium]